MKRPWVVGWHNEGGCFEENTDKSFTQKKEAIKYMRKLVKEEKHVIVLFHNGILVGIHDTIVARHFGSRMYLYSGENVALDYGKIKLK